MKPTKTSRSPQNIALYQTQVAINKAKSSWTFDKARSFGKMLCSFGYNQSDAEYVYPQAQLDAAITIKDVESFGEHLKCRALMSFLQSASQNNKPYYEREPNPVVEKSSIPALPAVVSPVVEQERVEQKQYVNFMPKCPGQSAILHPKQEEVASQIVTAFHAGSHGILLVAGTGTGKTYVAGSVIANLHTFNFFKGKRHGPWPVLYITKTSVVRQTQRVLAGEFGLGADKVHCLNIEQLRSFLGTVFVREKTTVVQGEPSVEWEWRQHLHPVLFLVDECQQVKNEGSEQSKIMQAATKIMDMYKVPVYFLFMSATPYTRVCEGRVFACSARKKISIGGVTNVLLTEENWHQYATTIAAPKDPYEYSPAAVDRFTTDMDDYIIRMKNVRPKFHARNSILRIQFRTEEEARQYQTAYERFLAKKAKLEGIECLNAAQSKFAILAQMNKFREEAEVIRAPWIAEAFVVAHSEGKSPCAAVAFKRTINGIVWSLIHEHGWTRRDISIIWGGNVKVASKKKDAAKTVLANDTLLAALKGAGITLEDLGLDFTEEELKEKSAEQIQFEKDNDLGPQNPEKRQREIDRFQRGISKCCIFTFKSGGVGLSLHHANEATKPREVYLTPVYSAMELVQGLGRCPRLTSLSDTAQLMCYYGGTIEDSVAAKVSQKLGCLSKVVRQRESWEDIILGSKYKTSVAEDDTKLLDAPGDEEEDNDIYIEGDDDEDTSNTEKT